jgi:hypothetical protein
MAIPENIEELLASGKIGFVPKNVDLSVAPSTPATGPASGGSNDELQQLRRRLVQLTHENQRLLNENHTMKEKLEQIKKIA